MERLFQEEIWNEGERSCIIILHSDVPQTPSCLFEHIVARLRFLHFIICVFSSYAQVTQSNRVNGVFLSGTKNHLKSSPNATADPGKCFGAKSLQALGKVSDPARFPCGRSPLSLTVRLK